MNKHTLSPCSPSSLSAQDTDLDSPKPPDEWEAYFSLDSEEFSTSTEEEIEDKSQTEISSRKIAQFLEDKSEAEISSRKTRRRKGKGSGCIYWRTVTKKGKQYQEAYYQYEFWDSGKRPIKSTKYIPKRLLASVQELEASFAPVQEVLRFLGVGEQLSPGRFEETSIKSPPKIRRKNSLPSQSKSPTKRRGKNKLPPSGHISPTKSEEEW